MQLTEPRAGDESLRGAAPGAGEGAPSSLPDQAQGPFKLWLGEGEGTGSGIRICRAGLTPLSELPSLSLSRTCERAERVHSGQPRHGASWCRARLFSPSGPWGMIKGPVSHVRCGKLCHRPKATRSRRQKFVPGTHHRPPRAWAGHFPPLPSFFSSLKWGHHKRLLEVNKRTCPARDLAHSGP